MLDAVDIDFRTAVFAKDVGLIHGQIETFLYHLLALLIVAGFTFFGSVGLDKLVDIMLGMRVREEQEDRGLDLSQHGEAVS